MTQTLTTDELRQIVDSHEKGYGMSVPINYGYLAARELLANREAQPVAYTEQCEISNMQATGLYLRGFPDNAQGRNIGLFTAPPAPAVPDDYQHLKNVQELYHKQEDRLFSLAQRINGPSFDKYSQSVDQAISVLEREIFGDDGGACRAAMLSQPVSQGGKLPDNVREALTLALQAMEFMGDTLNNIDAVCTEDVEYVTPAFNAIRSLLAAAPSVGN